MQSNQLSTSAESYAYIKPKLPSIEDDVYSVISRSGVNGVTIEEIRAALPQYRMTSLSRRPGELVKDGRVVINGTRTNSIGRKMKVFVLAQYSAD